MKIDNDTLISTGGRMSTSRCNKDGRCTVDLGAQYISATPNFQQTHAKYAVFGFHFPFI